jgi:hypothetical protein
MRKRKERKSKGLAALRPAVGTLVLPLLPSPRLRLAVRILMLGILFYLMELLITGHGAVAGAVMLAAAASGAWKQPRDAASRQLVVTPDGRLFLDAMEGAMQEMQLRPETLRLGPHLLLVLSNGGHRHRLLLGPDNLAPAALAALKCRLPMGSAAPGTALHSPAAPSRSQSP